MKAAAFSYRSAPGAAAASEMLRGYGGAARIMAGGQSLGPMLNLRLARPEWVVDVSRAAELRGVREEPDAIVYGAAVTHAEIEDGVVPDATPGWLAAVARRIAYRAVRNRGTLGGSLAHADPAADWVNVMTALGAAAVVVGPDGERRVPLMQFFTGPFTTVLAPDEVILGVRVARRGPDARWGYWKFCAKAGDFAQASAAALVDPARGETRILVGAIERPPLLLGDPEALLGGRRTVAEAVAVVLPERSAAAIALHVAAVRRAIALAMAQQEPP